MNKYFHTCLSKQIKKKQVSEQNCLSVRAFLSIPAHLACSFSLILNGINKLMFSFKYANARKHISEQDKSMVKSDQCLRLFSSRRQPPLLVSYYQLKISLMANTGHSISFDTKRTFIVLKLFDFSV